MESADEFVDRVWNLLDAFDSYSDKPVLVETGGDILLRSGKVLTYKIGVKNWQLKGADA